MAYFQPLAKIDISYNIARYHLLKQWLSLQTEAESKKLRKGDLFSVLKTLFGVWERCVIQLEGEGLWGETERKMRDDVRQRVRLLKIAEKDSRIKDKELDCWNGMWAIGKVSKRGRKAVIKENFNGTEIGKGIEDGTVSSTLEGEQVDAEKLATKEEI